MITHIQGCSQVEPVNYHFFIHVPKTAGTSFRVALERRFDEERTLPTARQMKECSGNYPAICTLRELPAQTWRQTQFLRGHYPYTLGALFPREPVRMILLRDPIERSVSALKHAKRLSVRFGSRSLLEIAKEKPFMRNAVANLQTKMLTMPLESWFANGRRVDSINVPFPMNAESLELAIARLETCQFVGLTERYDDSLRLLRAMFGWQSVDNLHANKAPETDENESSVTDELIEVLQQYNRLDLYLYKAAENLFEKRLARLAGNEKRANER